MAINEKSVLLKSKDADGNTNFLYPITTADNVDGLEELVDGKVDAAPAKGMSVLSMNPHRPDELGWVEWRSIGHCGGITFASTSAAQSKIVYSLDNGITWAIASVPTDIIGDDWVIDAFTYGNGRFVAVGYYGMGSGMIVTSEDGIEWTVRAWSENPGYFNFKDVCYGNGKFVGIGVGYVGYSTDGITWTISEVAYGSWYYAIAYGNGTFVAVGDNGTTLYSNDGINWTSNTMPTTDAWRDIAYDGNNYFVAIKHGYDGSGNILTNEFAYSYNGINWFLRTQDHALCWDRVMYADGIWYIFGLDENNYFCGIHSDYLFTSEWTFSKTNWAVQFNDFGDPTPCAPLVSCSNGVVIAIHGSGGEMLMSMDNCTTWITEYTGLSQDGEIVTETVAQLLGASDHISLVIAGSEPASTNTVWFDTSASV